MRTRQRRRGRLNPGGRWLAAWMAVLLLLCAAPAAPQSSNPDVRPSAATLSGILIDDTGAPVAAARVTLSLEGLPQASETFSQQDGHFSFSNVAPGPFRLSISVPGFAGQTVSGVLVAGEVATLPPVRLTLAADAIAVHVSPTNEEVAQRQIEEQAQQRVLGVVPNFFVTYDPAALPLTARQKLELSWKSRVDPVRFGVAAIVAGVQQARNDFSGFGPGVEGYAKRYAAAYATAFTGGLIRQVLMPALFKQDPRYFYKGTGSTGSRIAYAMSTAVVRKGDNGHWQPDYSGILGSLAAGGLSNLYYPAEDRKSIRLTLQNTAIGIGGAAVGHLAQEFLFKKLTTRSRGSAGLQPEPATPESPALR